MQDDVSTPTDREGRTTRKHAARSVVVTAIAIALVLGGSTEVARANLEGVSDHDFVIDWSDPTKGIDTASSAVEREEATPFGVRLLPREFSVPVAKPLQSSSQQRSLAIDPQALATGTAANEVTTRRPRRFSFDAGFFTMGDYRYDQRQPLMPPIAESSGNPIELTEEHSAQILRFVF